MLVKQASDCAAEMAAVNELLRHASPDWDVVAGIVGDVNETVTSTTPTEEGWIEPYLYRTLSDGLLRLWPAVTARDRKAARLAAEAVRQALLDIADAADRDGPRDPKHTASWVEDVVGELDEAAVRALLGVSYRTWRRWLKETGGTTPTGSDAARLWAVAAALDHLRRSFTPAGAVAWFSRPHPQLEGRAPATLLADPAEHQRVIDVAAGSRVSVAA